MPSKKNRGTGKDGAPFPVSKAMKIGKSQSMSHANAGVLHGITTLPEAIGAKAQAKGGKKTPIRSSAGYDVKTRISIPSSKSLASKSRTKK